MDTDQETVAVEAAENEGLTNEGTSPEGEQPAAPETPDFQAIGTEFNAKLADILTEYDNKLPFIYMAKILMNLSIDLLAQQNAIQAQYVMEQIVAQARKNSEELAAKNSRIIKV